MHNLRIIMADFSARIGTKQANDQVVGVFGKGIVDEKGGKLNFQNEKILCHEYSF